jgi:hypothetical protein
MTSKIREIREKIIEANSLNVHPNERHEKILLNEALVLLFALEAEVVEKDGQLIAKRDSIEILKVEKANLEIVIKSNAEYELAERQKLQDKLDAANEKIEKLAEFLNTELVAMRNVVAENENDQAMRPIAQVLKGKIARYQDFYPNPLQIEFGEGRIAVSSFRDKDGAGVVFEYAGGEKHKIGEPIPEIQDEEKRHLPCRGEVYLKFKNIESLNVVQGVLAKAKESLAALLKQKPQEGK